MSTENMVSKKQSIAFLCTEYQQNILFSICLQQNIKIDILFLREDIQQLSLINNYAKEIVIVKNISYQLQSLNKFYDEFHNDIKPKLDKNSYYDVYTWSYEYPTTQLLLHKFNTLNIFLIEDGVGAYMNQGILNFRQGSKHCIFTFIMSLFIKILSLNLKLMNKKHYTGWSLFEGCYPLLNIQNNLIEHKNFSKIICSGYQNNDTVNIQDNSVVFIQQAFVEETIFSESEYIKIHVNIINRIKNDFLKNYKILLWNLHPRTNTEDEVRRTNIISKKTGVMIRHMKSDLNIEYIAHMNKNKYIKYCSICSTSLYVIKAIVEKENSVFLIEDNAVEKKIPEQVQINKLFIGMGIRTI